MHTVLLSLPFLCAAEENARFGKEECMAIPTYSIIGLTPSENREKSTIGDVGYNGER